MCYKSHILGLPFGVEQKGILVGCGGIILGDRNLICAVKNVEMTWDNIST
jgi:hypothetical protein